MKIKNTIFRALKFGTGVMAFSFVFLCGKEKKLPVERIEVEFPHPEGWRHGLVYLQTGIGACNECHGVSSIIACSSCHSTYPHPDRWGSEGHRSIARQAGNEECTMCHGKSFEGGEIGGSCYTCHQYPHKENWEKGHGEFLKGKNYNLSSCATSCHGVSFDGGDTGISCGSCHKDYPHTELWAEKEKHGKSVITKGKEGCKMCHGEDFKGGISEISCYSCHFYPHTDGWDKPSEHGGYVMRLQNTSCRNCHGDDLRGGNSKVSCYSCHKLPYPHSTSWEIYHSIYIYQTNYFTYTCANTCHGSNLNGGESGVSCGSCHHSEPEWGSKGHGRYALQTNKKGCGFCHGSDYKGGIVETSCFSCHSSYPHNGEKWMDTDAEMFHGKVFLTEMEDCFLCHGLDYGGGISGVSCFSCHSTYPHLGEWIINHGDYVMKEGDISCRTCHNPFDVKIELPISSFPQCQFCH